MGRRRSKADDAAIGLLIVIVVVALVAAVVIPIAWIVVELRRLSIPRGEEAFEPTWNEKRNRENAQRTVRAMDEEIAEAHTSARVEGCIVRSDGLYDERRVFARDVNNRIICAQGKKDGALLAKYDAESGPESRWKAWASAEQYCWAGRVAVVAFVISLFLPIEAYSSLVWGKDSIAKFMLHMYTSAVPLGLIAYFAAGFWTKKYRPELSREG